MRWRCEVWSEVWQHFSSILPCKSTPSSDWEEQSGLHLSSSAWDQRGLCPEDPGTWAECIWHRNKLVKSQLIIIYWVMVYLDNRKTQTIVQQTNMKQNWYHVSSSKISPNAKRRSGWGIYLVLCFCMYLPGTSLYILSMDFIALWTTLSLWDFTIFPVIFISVFLLCSSWGCSVLSVHNTTHTEAASLTSAFLTAFLLLLSLSVTAVLCCVGLIKVWPHSYN